MQQLKVGSSLQGGKYKIESVLGQGGFGITYLATQELLDRKVCIKEFFFKEYCERDEATSHVTLGTNSNRELVERFMEKFIKEARTISTLNHPHIIRIYDIFKENNTAYYVMEYIEGESLNDMVNRRGALPEDMAVGYIKQVASALEFVHKHSINHLDVKPANIMVRKEDSQAVLIDFGLSKQYDAQGGQTSTTPVGISHGYAPMEQYNAGGVSAFSPQTDIYSLGATLYKLVTGNTPPQAGEVLNEGLPELPNHLSTEVKSAILQTMQIRKKDRPRNISSFIEIISPDCELSNTKHNTNVDVENNDISQLHHIEEETQVINGYTNNSEEDKQSVSNSFTTKNVNDTNYVLRHIKLGVIFIPVYYFVPLFSIIFGFNFINENVGFFYFIKVVSLVVCLMTLPPYIKKYNTIKNVVYPSYIYYVTLIVILMASIYSLMELVNYKDVSDINIVMHIIAVDTIMMLFSIALFLLLLSKKIGVLIVLILPIIDFGVFAPNDCISYYVVPMYFYGIIFLYTFFIYYKIFKASNIVPSL